MGEPIGRGHRLDRGLQYPHQEQGESQLWLWRVLYGRAALGLRGVVLVILGPSAMRHRSD
jgi:hypothetical protein